MDIGQLCPELAVVAGYSDTDRFVAETVLKNPSEYPWLYAREMRRREMVRPVEQKPSAVQKKEYCPPRWLLRSRAGGRQAVCCGIIYMMPQSWLRKMPRCSVCGRAICTR